MQILENKSNDELLKSLLAETAKAQNELNCARNDLDKAQGRLRFVLLLTNEMINRPKD
jgi:hypothetical protein